MCNCYTPFFHIGSLQFSSALPAVHKLFKPFTVELFRLLSKPSPCSSLNYSITLQTNSLVMFLQSCKQLEVRRHQIHAVVGYRTTSNLHTLYRHWSGNTNVRSGIIMLRGISFFPRWMWFICCFDNFRIFTLIVRVNFCTSHQVLLASDASAVLEHGEHKLSAWTWIFNFLFLVEVGRWRSRDWLSFLGCNDTPNSHHLWAVQKIIILTFRASE